MIFRIGDIFSSEMKTLVNTVNCVGVMGKGIALEFKKRYPKMYREYMAMCERGHIRPGKPYYYEDALAFTFEVVLYYRWASMVQG